jgi:hypothetical protein
MIYNNVKRMGEFRAAVNDVFMKWSLPTRQVAILDITKLLIELDKAYGGCHDCYGKGYSTNLHGITGSPDFIGDRVFEEPLKNNMVFCHCERGKQLEKICLSLY